MTIKEGALKGLKYAIGPAIAGMLIADSNSQNFLGKGWDSAKVGAAVLGTGAAIGAGKSAVDEYTQYRADVNRLRAAQRAVLAQNNLLTLQDKQGTTRYIEPRDHSVTKTVLSTAQHALDIPSKAGKFVGDVVSSSGHEGLAGIAQGVTTAGASSVVSVPAIKAMNKGTELAKKYAPFLLNNGTNPANMSEGFFSEKTSYFIGNLDNSEDMAGSLVDFESLPLNDSLERERQKDLLGPLARVSEDLTRSMSYDRNFSQTPLGRIQSGDFGIFGAVAKGLTSSVKFKDKVRMMLPGKSGRFGAITNAAGAVEKTTKNLTDSLAKNADEFAGGSNSTLGKTFKKIGSGVGAIVKTAGENPGVADKVIKNVRNGASLAAAGGAYTLAKQARQNAKNGQVQAPQTNPA